MPCPQQCPLRGPPSPPSPPPPPSDPSDVFFSPAMRLCKDGGCDASRHALHMRHNVSLATRCTGVRDACVVGERVILGPGRAGEASALASTFSRLWRDYVWGNKLNDVAARGTISALDAQPERYCSYNSTVKKNGCQGDADEGDGRPHWNAVDAAATAAAVWGAPRLPFGVTWFPVYPQNFAESFSNSALSLFELSEAGWLPADAQLLPASSWYDFWYQPFSPQRPLTTLQRLEVQGQRVICFRRLALCSLGSFVFDKQRGAGAGGPPRRPWDCMQKIIKEQMRASGRPPRSSARTPFVLSRAAGGDSGGSSELRVLLVARRGMFGARNMRNVEDLARALDRSAASRGVRISAEVASLGHGLVRDAETVRSFDVLVSAHGGDVLNTLSMHRGSSVVEVRGYAWEDDGHGVWPGWYARLFSLDHAVHHYVVQLGLNNTVGAQALQAQQPGRPLSPHQTWSLDMHLPHYALKEVLAAIVDVGGDLDAYLARLGAGDGTVLWDGLGWGSVQGPGPKRARRYARGDNAERQSSIA